jgi:hypothetical protein
MPRKSGVHPELSARDRLAFRCLLRARVMRTGDFVPLVFPSLPIARRRLRKLHDAGFVVAFIEQLHLDTRWVLDTKGYEALAGRDPDAPVQRAVRDLAPLRDHHAMLVRFWVLLVRACHDSPTTSLERFSFEWELATPPGTGTRGLYLPDAVVSLKTGDKTNHLVVEADTGTENPSYVAKHKITVFGSLLRARKSVHGHVPDRQLILAPSERRLRSIARAARQLPLDGVYGRILAADDTEFSLNDGWQPLARLIT